MEYNKKNTLSTSFSILGVIILIMGLCFYLDDSPASHDYLNHSVQLFEKQIMEDDEAWHGLSLEETKKKKSEFIQDITTPGSLKK